VKLLFLGGTGNLSTACAREAVAQGHTLTVLTRGVSRDALPNPVERVRGDARDPGTLRQLARRGFDAAVNFLAFDAEDVARDAAAFGGNVGQYVLISSASVYEKPPRSHVVTEEMPLGNPFWEYARGKIAAERELLRAVAEDGLSATIVRPSYTYGGTDYTVVKRMREGREIVVPGDGTSLFTLTHASDLARGVLGLLGNERALGEAFHVTSDEVLSWNQVHQTIGRVIGVEPRIVHVPSDVIARIDARRGASLLGDKAWSLIFDNSKVRRVVPGFRPRVDFVTGVAESIRWFEADPGRQRTDAEETVERILQAWHRAMSAL
jgi:nucleoside-diphosphate-sugar epimerase